MRRLNGGDIQFIYTETPDRHLHTLKVLVFDRTRLPAGYDVGTTRQVIADRLHRLDPLRWELRLVPGRLFHPVWVDRGTEVDLHHHVRAATVPSPGTHEAFCALVSDIASTPLPRDRPLWDLTVVDGLEGDRLALVWKIHHALADGTASHRLIEELLDADPDPAMTGGDRPALTADPEPSPGALVRGAARDLGGLLVELPGMLARLGRAAVRGVIRKRAGGPQPAIAFTGGPTPFNEAVDARRVWACTEVDLDDVKAVRQALGGTVNDVFLALVSTVVRDHLAARDRLPERSLSAAVPVTIRHEVADTPWGNFPSNYFVSLATDIADPRRRFEAVAASQAAAKAWHDQRDHRLMFEWMGVYPFWAAYSRGLPRLVQGVMGRPSYTLIASNVRGPEATLYHCGSPMVGLHSMGPLFQELGLNVTAWSYQGRMSISVHTCRRHVPDVWDLVDRFPKALAELRAAAGTA